MTSIAKKLETDTHTRAKTVNFVIGVMSVSACVSVLALFALLRGVF